MNSFSQEMTVVWPEDAAVQRALDKCLRSRKLGKRNRGHAWFRSSRNHAHMLEVLEMGRRAKQDLALAGSLQYGQDQLIVERHRIFHLPISLIIRAAPVARINLAIFLSRRPGRVNTIRRPVAVDDAAALMQSSPSRCPPLAEANVGH